MSKGFLTPAKVREIVERELSGMPEDLAARARRYLVEPYLSERVWSYGPETFQCWIVLVDDAKNSGTGIGYCGEGVWQPDRKWVLLWVEIRGPRDADLGQDFELVHFAGRSVQRVVHVEQSSLSNNGNRGRMSCGKLKAE